MDELVNLTGKISFLFLKLTLNPLKTLPALWGITLLSLLSAVFILGVFRISSNPDKIKRAKDLLKSELLKLWLYNHDFRLVMRSQFGIARYSFRYIRHTVIPLLIMAGPVTALLTAAAVGMSIVRYGLTRKR